MVNITKGRVMQISGIHHSDYLSLNMNYYPNLTLPESNYFQDIFKNYSWSYRSWLDRVYKGEAVRYTYFQSYDTFNSRLWLYQEH